MSYQNFWKFFAVSLLSGLIGGGLVWGMFYYTQQQTPISISEPVVETAPETPPPTIAPTISVPTPEISRKNAIVMATQKVSPAVVTISVLQTRVVRYSPFHDDFFSSFFRDFGPYWEYEEQIPSLGSGVILNREGYVLTNAHVVHGATDIMITLPDGREFQGKIIGVDEIGDLALLKIEGEKLPYVKLGDSDDLIIGEWGIAIGNPFGNLIGDAHPTVTVGVISGVKRSFRPSSGQTRIYRNMIQTDAAINPGNSGGPLVNCDGEVIGLNTFIFTKSGGNLGIGFAIPVNYAKEIVAEIMKYGKVRQVWIGLQVQNITPALVNKLDLDIERGLLITQVDEGSPADKAGLKVTDVIKEIDGVSILTWEEANNAFRGKRVDEKVRLLLLREKAEINTIMILEEIKEIEK